MDLRVELELFLYIMILIISIGGLIYSLKYQSNKKAKAFDHHLNFLGTLNKTLNEKGIS